MSKDYYKILGVDKGASAEEIKKSFRKLAHQHHPDKTGGDEAKFKEINEAYQVLGDNDKRQKYDQFGSDFESQGGFGGGAGWEDFMRQARGGGGNFGDFQFNFGGFDMGDLFGFGGGRQQQSAGQDIQVDVELSFKDAAFGIEKEINLTKRNACTICHGNGAEPGSEQKTCTNCKGQGQINQMQRTILGSFQTAVVCADCHGSGQKAEKACKHCRGEGALRSDSNLKVKIPAGIDNGEAIRLNGQGEFPGAGGQSGDLYVLVHIKKDANFLRDGFEVYTEATISYPQAVLGATIEVETLDGKKNIVVPEGTASGQRIRLKGYGVPHLRGGGRGDQFVTVTVNIPKKVSRTAKKLLEDLQAEL